jgi:hypothetical protein
MRFWLTTSAKQSTAKPVLALSLAVVCVLSTGLTPVDAKKKKPKINEDEVKSAIEPVQTDVRALMGKIQSRLLFTPEDNGKLDELKWQLMDLMALYGKSNLLAQPVYQAAVLFESRERLNDAYDMYQFVESTYPEEPVATRAGFKRHKLEQRFGSDLFTVPPKVALADNAAAPAEDNKKK